MISGRWRSWGWDFGLLAGLGLTIWLGAAGVTHEVDLAVRSWCMDHDPSWARGGAVVLNHFGQGWLLTYILGGGLTLWALVRTRSWRALLPIATAYLLVGLPTLPLKLWTHRDAPSSDLPPDISVRFFNDLAVDYSRSFPSGHVVNTLVWWPAIVLLAAVALGRPLPVWLRRTLLIAPPIIVFCTTIYLSWHWLTDDIGAVFLGLFLALLFWRLPWDRWLPRSVDHELRGPDTPPTGTSSS